MLSKNRKWCHDLKIAYDIYFSVLQIRQNQEVGVGGSSNVDMTVVKIKH